MTQYRVLSAIYEPTQNRSRFRRAGEVVELSDEYADQLLRQGAIEKLDEGEDEDAGQSDEQDVADQGVSTAPAGPVELPARPSNSASRDTWHDYLVDLEEATEDPLGDLKIPTDAKRDDLVRIGDERVAAYHQRVGSYQGS